MISSFPIVIWSVLLLVRKIKLGNTLLLLMGLQRVYSFVSEEDIGRTNDLNMLRSIRHLFARICSKHSFLIINLEKWLHTSS